MNKTNNNLVEELIAPCGMDCRICIGFFGYAVNGRKRKMKCSGCRPRNKTCAFVKKDCNNLSKNKIDFCFECKDFPCKKLLELDDRYQRKYRMSMIENLKYIKAKGMNKFLKLQDEKYICQKCGELICVHNDICYNCGFNKN
jgi:hypothetical protein